MQKARFFTRLDNGIVQCHACRHKCSISDGQRGICGVRMNHGGDLFLLVYGKSPNLNADPIEKKPLYHFLPGTISLSIGTYGCNFSCPFCQNYELSQNAKESLKNRHLHDLPPDAIVEQAVKMGTKSISYTYSEPTVWTEYALDTISLAREKGIKSVYVSNGYQSEILLSELLPVLDAINVDLKSFSDEFYKHYCGARLNPVLENIETLFRGGVHVEVTTLLIPELNDSTDELSAIAKFLAGVSVKLPWHISRFFPMYNMIDRNPTPIETLEKAYEIGRENGLQYVYLGNVQDIERSSTFCPACGEMTVRRVGYLVEKIYEKNLRCANCRTVQDIIE